MPRKMQRNKAHEKNWSEETKIKKENERKQQEEHAELVKEEAREIEERSKPIYTRKKKSTSSTDAEIKQAKTNKIMGIINERASYYRENPQRFVEEYLGIKLKLFQKILIYAMMHYDYFLFIACRGLGKTFLTALFACVRGILYPGTKIVVCSATFKQGRELVLKITDDFAHKSSLLRSEIEAWSTGQNDCYIKFRNGSIIRVVTATESSRGGRSNILIIDESRLVSQKIVDSILKPFNAEPRHPRYLDKTEYKYYPREMNKEMYLSSAWYQASELYDKAKAYTANFLDDRLNYFICDLPYQLSIKEGLLMREQIENEMSEQTFSYVTFMMEREGKFYGSGENSLFNLRVLNERRILTDSFHDLDFYKTTDIQIPKKKIGEVRILSVDVALLASKKHDNDASAFVLNCAVPTNTNEYISNIVYIETVEDVMTEELGLMVMRYFYQYNCDYLGLDANGIGQAILDYIMADRYDPVYGMTYCAINCCNNDDLAERCKVKYAPKVVYAIKANAKSNNDMCLALRAGCQNGSINFLINDNDIEQYLAKSIKGYSKLTEIQKVKLKLPYVQTTLMIDELINLKHSVKNGLISVYEHKGMRKDRYSALEYNYYVTQQLSLKLKPRQKNLESLVDSLTIRRGVIHSY